MSRCSNPVVAVTVPDDVYLTYSIFILTSAMRITSFALNLRTEFQPPPPPQKLLTGNDTEDSRGWLIPAEGPPAYVSLLGNEPYTPPAVLSRPLGLPSNPRLAVPGSASLNKSEFVLTPDTLRYLGKTVERFNAQIREIQLAHKASELRHELQQQEVTRQQEKFRDMTELIEKLKGPLYDASQEKLRRIQNAQKALLARLNRVLQLLMEQASPELSEHETKWFEELKRLKEEVTGVGRYDEGSLVARAKSVCALLLSLGWC
jgi:nucleoporin NUP82